MRRRRFLGLVWVDNAHESTLLIRAIETEPSGADDLAALLRGVVARGEGSPPEYLDGLPLDELLRRGIDRVGYTR